MINLFLTENSVNKHLDKQCKHQRDAAESCTSSESVLFARIKNVQKQKYNIIWASIQKNGSLGFAT